MVRAILDEAANPITVSPQDAPVMEQGSQVLPAAIKIAQPHTGIGAAGGLAQPLPEADE